MGEGQTGSAAIHDRSDGSDAGAANTASPVQVAGGILQGTYSGKLPCADCSALLTSIAFYAEGSPQSPAGYYVRTSTYMGAPKGNVVSIDAGHYLLQKGTPDTPDRTVFSLQSNTSDNLESYLLQGDSLVPLGQRRQTHPGALQHEPEKAMSLKSSLS